ncbi:helix-turn-helix domain-containing protein [Actinotignum timonense]|uniref:helix-turn-helix domain-containing protein n=1 Tax=Actinotignum TaxID=1653174 RepID=UPI0004797CF9|nr:MULTISPECIES: helix-turn-helix transcriptional regulator [Actinotignum]AIE83077.1 hypothetical protein FB03_07245 [Actinotignum schaalii]MDK6905666.1 helix-turn-helix transcriptional regulator [Actinotignum timonense]MDK8782726.1 helix-turn-helix transcriptional regulator [Actinotignum timonense]MDY5138818.1 helix-turn-helix transcriptional regulator [Actinotignum timonense]WQN45237.1 helix-turn-helix transcriptional regulator [Actinotignum schaalii]
MEQVNEYALAVGQQVKKYRAHQGLSCEDLSGKSGVALPVLTRLEAGMGDVNGADVLRLAAALGVGVEAIFGRTLIQDDITFAARPGEKDGAMKKMRDAAFDYFAALRMVTAP